MNWKEIIKKVSEGKIRPESLLEGAFAFSHRGEFESPNQPAPPSPTIFIPQTQVGYLVFDGQGNVKGEITVVRNGGNPQKVTPLGSYTVGLSPDNVFEGTITTNSALNPTTDIGIEYSFVIADDGKELKYAVQKATSTNTTNGTQTNPQVLVWGTMRKIYP